MILLLMIAQCAAQQKAAPSASILPTITVNMLGQVNQPARLKLPIGSGLLDAIAAAGGFTKIGNPSRVIVIHKTAGDKADVTKIDMKKILGGIDKDYALRDGDTVQVGEAVF